MSKAKIYVRAQGCKFVPPVKKGICPILVDLDSSDISQHCVTLTAYQFFGKKGVLELCNNPTCQKDQSLCPGLQLRSLSITDRLKVVKAVIAALEGGTILNSGAYLPAWVAREKLIKEHGDVAPVPAASAAAMPAAALAVVPDPAVKATEDRLADAEEQLAAARARIGELERSAEEGFQTTPAVSLEAVPLEAVPLEAMSISGSSMMVPPPYGAAFGAVPQVQPYMTISGAMAPPSWGGAALPWSSPGNFQALPVLYGEKPGFVPCRFLGFPGGCTNPRCQYYHG
jgi:hypothetical protein